MKEITDIRLLGQQLSEPQFDTPHDLVAWMGAIQGQDYNMAKWAIGLRLKSATIDKVEQAFAKGEILRTHVMRPTWHIVAAEDIRWMLQLSGARIKSATNSWSKDLGVDEKLFTKTNDLIIKMLEGNKSLTKKEIGERLSNEKIEINTNRLTHFLMRAEIESIICSGADNGKQPTYALIEERVVAVPPLHKEEALAKLALNYFRSHSPAGLSDFVWWSGLSMTEARHAIGLIQSELITEKFASQNLYIHQSYADIKEIDEVLHFMPSFDEYLISYKDRTHALELHHYPKAFNNYGTFHPVIMYNGAIVGNWKKIDTKGKPNCEISIFDKKAKVKKSMLNSAMQNYISFIQPSDK